MFLFPIRNSSEYPLISCSFQAQIFKAIIITSCKISLLFSLFPEKATPPSKSKPSFHQLLHSRYCCAYTIAGPARTEYGDQFLHKTPAYYSRLFTGWPSFALLQGRWTWSVLPKRGTQPLHSAKLYVCAGDKSTQRARAHVSHRGNIFRHKQPIIISSILAHTVQSSHSIHRHGM